MRRCHPTGGASDGPARARHAAHHAVELIEQLGAQVVALYAAGPDELGTLATAHELTRLDRVLCYPRMTPGQHALAFFEVTDPSRLEPGRFGIAEPDTTARSIPLEAIDVFVVPGVAFDRSGGRLGRGKGYYDATLAHARGKRVGFCFAWQVVDHVPRARHDAVMEFLVTDAGPIALDGTATPHPGPSPRQARAQVAAPVDDTPQSLSTPSNKYDQT